ncbi:MAG: hypothetical protein ACREH8_08155 [Opitutaceae bacterium]
MKLLLAATAATAVLLAAVNVWGHTRETAIVAAMKLSDEPNYSWIATVCDDARTYDIEGKTERGGCTWQRQPMPKVIARRLGRDAGTELESIFSAPLRYVVQTESGWRSFEELPKKHSDWNDDQWYYVSVARPLIRTPDMPADATGIGPFGLPSVIYLPVSASPNGEGKVYSNAQFALALPHDELAVIVSSHVDFVVDDSVASGTLSDLGAQLLLVHDGHEYITPVTAGGRFKIWLNGNSVEKYTVELGGIVVVDRKTVYVRQKSMTVLKDIGTTKVEVPADARRRL